MHRNRRKYTDREKAAALACLDANGGNCFKTAQEIGIPRVTLIEWSESRGVSKDVSEFRQENRQELADMFEELARKSVETAMGLQGHEKTTLAMAATAAGIAVDKMQLLRALPTQIIDNVAQLTDEQLQRIASGESPLNVLASPGSSGTGETPPLASERVN